MKNVAVLKNNKNLNPALQICPKWPDVCDSELVKMSSWAAEVALLPSTLHTNRQLIGQKYYRTKKFNFPKLIHLPERAAGLRFICAGGGVTMGILTRTSFYSVKHLPSSVTWISIKAVKLWTGTLFKLQPSVLPSHTLNRLFIMHHKVVILSSFSDFLIMSKQF